MKLALTIKCIILSFYLLSPVMQASAQSLDSLLSIYNTTTDKSEKLNLLMTISWVCKSQQAFTKAIGYYNEALTLLPEERHFDRLSVLRNMAYCYEELGDFEHETEIFEQILAIHNKSGNTQEVVKVLQNLSALYVRRKDYTKAANCNHEIIRIAERDKNYLWGTMAYNNMGFIQNALGNRDASTAYFNKSYELVQQQAAQLSTDTRSTILINLGIAYATMGSLDHTRKFLAEALDIRKKENNPLKVAEVLNYMAAYDFISNETQPAIEKVTQVIQLVEPLEHSEEKNEILANSYKLMSELMLRRNDLKGVKKYYDAYNNIQQRLLEQERKRYSLLFDHQLDVERRENEIRLLLAQNEKEIERNEFELRQSRLEQEKKENELQLKQNEIALLKQQQELQEAQFKNQQLEKQRIGQTLELVQEKAKANEQLQRIDLLQKDQELKNLQLQKRQQEIEQLERDNELNARLKAYGILIIALLTFIIIVGLTVLRYRKRKNQTLAMQHATIVSQNEELTAVNEELTSVNEQLNARTEELFERNATLQKAQHTIHEQNEILKSYNKNLEAEVEHRTRELSESNKKLTAYNTQLEQFAYAISHNIRAPIAQLLGLVSIMASAKSKEESGQILEMIKRSSLDLDNVIQDLHEILKIQNTSEIKMEEVAFQTILDKVLAKLNDSIDTIKPDFRINFSESKTLFTNPQYAEIILYNLVSNALKFKAPNRSCIIHIRTHHQLKWTVLTVGDNGIGIDLKTHGKQLFGLYKRFNLFAEGKGLGLYLVKTQVEALHGRIEVESTPGIGTTFKVFLPSAESGVVPLKEADVQSKAG
jgi:signal transduction histidine kinase/tetratricopeptide (TPR) repeat protein